MIATDTNIGVYAHRMSLELCDTNLRGPYILSCEIARRNPRHMAGLPKGGTFAGFRCRKAITRQCRSTGASARADVTGKKEQEQGRVLDKPISTPEPAAGSPREGTPRPAGQPRQGTLGERRVSEPPPEARPLPVPSRERAGAIPGAADPIRSLRSRTAATGAPVSPSAATRMHPGLPDAAAGPPGSAEQAVGFLTTYRSLRALRDRYSKQADPYPVCEIDRAIRRAYRFTKRRFKTLRGDASALSHADPVNKAAERAYRLLQEKAGRAENEGDAAEATKIRTSLEEIDRHAEKHLLELCDKHGLAWPASIQGPRRTPPAALPSWGWCETHWKLRGIRDHLKQAGESQAAMRFNIAANRLKSSVDYHFDCHLASTKKLNPARGGIAPRPELLSATEQKYRILEARAGGADAASGAGVPTGICESMKSINEAARRALRDLIRDYGPLEDLAARAGLNELLAPVTAGPGATHATAQVTVTPPLQPSDPVPAPVSVFADTRPSMAGSAALSCMAQLLAAPPGPSPRDMPAPAASAATAPGPEVPPVQRQANAERFGSDVAQLLAAPPGPSSRDMPAPAASTAMAPGPEVPLKQRQAIAERFSSDVALLDAGFALGSGATGTLGWDARRADRVLVDLHRLSSSAAMDPATAAALPGIDWSGIEALLGVMDSPPASPSPSRSPRV